MPPKLVQGWWVPAGVGLLVGHPSCTHSFHSRACGGVWLVVRILNVADQVSGGLDPLDPHAVLHLVSHWIQNDGDQ